MPHKAAERSNKLNNFADNYAKDLAALIEGVDSEKLYEIRELLNKTRSTGGRIFVAGNGGSAATVNHFAADFSKNAVKGIENRFCVISLSTSLETITALGNDDGYENSFKHQIYNYKPCENDVLLCVSASGNSPNIINLVDYCKEQGMKIVGISGIKGGKLKDLSDIAVYIESDSYEKVEDVQMAVLHMITYSFKYSCK